MRLSLAPWGETIEEQVNAARAAEQAGFESVWVSELHRSAFVPAAAIAAATNRMTVGTAIALAFVRSPMTTALAAMDVDDVSGGRFVLGLSAGVRRLNEDWHGARYGKPVQHLRETIEIVRTLVAQSHLGQPIEFEGDFAAIRLRGYERPFPPVRTEIPVFVGAMAPMMLRLAGSIADGWISHELCSLGYLREQAIPELERGLDSAGRQRSDLTVVASACCVPDSDRARARRHAAGLVAFYATVKTYRPFFEFHGHGSVVDAVRERFLAGDEDGMCDACPDELVDQLTIAGTPDEIRERLDAYGELVDVVKVSPPTHLVSPEIIRDSQAGLLEMLGGM